LVECSLDNLHHALRGDLSSFVTEFLKDDFPFVSRKAVFGSNVGQDTLHGIQRDTIGLVLGSSGTHNFLLEAHGGVHSVAVREEEKESVSNEEDKRWNRCHRDVTAQCQEGTKENSLILTILLQDIAEFFNSDSPLRRKHTRLCRGDDTRCGDTGSGEAK
jgi:hypothetical protein